MSHTFRDYCNNIVITIDGNVLVADVIHQGEERNTPSILDSLA